MLTREGRTVLVVALLAAGAGRLLSVVELFVVAATLVALLLVATVAVRLRRLRLEVDRQVRPTVIQTGTEARVDLRVANRADRRTPVLRLHDRVSGTRGATLLLAPLGPGREASASYRLPTEGRGQVRLGPLRAVISDPFGLVEVHEEAAQTTTLTVLPAVTPIVPPPLAPGDQPLTRARQAPALRDAGDDFHSLRAYVVGDDLRRVHWRSTARQDDLMVRQVEQPWEGRTAVLLDARTEAHTAESFEVAVEAAASVLAAAWRRGDALRLVSTSAGDHGAARGQAQVDRFMEDLAAVSQGIDAPLERTLGPLAHDRAGGALVVVTSTRATPADLAAVAHLGRRFGTVIALRVEPEPGAADARGAPQRPPPVPAPALDVLVPHGAALGRAWDGAVRRRARRSASSAGAAAGT